MSFDPLALIARLNLILLVSSKSILISKSMLSIIKLALFPEQVGLTISLLRKCDLTNFL